MAKSKYAPALFEVMNRQKNTGKLGVPKWWKGGPGGPQPEGGEPSEGESGAAPQAGSAGQESEPLTLAGQSQPVRTALDTGVRSSGQREYAHAAESVDDDRPRTAPGRGIGFGLESGRINLSLSPVHAAAFCGVLLIVLIAAFQVGKGFAAPAAEKNNGLTLLDQKPNSSVLDQPAGRPDAPPSRAGIKPPGPGAQAAATTPPAPPEQEVLKVGSHYVLFDSYPPDALPAAEFVQKWLASTHNIQTVLRERRGRYWLVGIDLSGDKATCERYAEKIKALGPEVSRALYKAGLPVYGLKDPMPFLIASEK